MKIIGLIIATAALIVASTGCMSLEARGKGTQSGLYPGIKAGTEYNKGAANATGLGSAMGPAIVTIDRPFSFALDTVLLPIDLLGSIFGGKKEKAAEPEPPQPEPAPQP
ncbi:MAG: YceK/YidQ family lipoprotein [Verrucomicrobia subdivision 3 bacterium]|nr:YceK/YidQ family lipoprotein [Limisphaerales bacterium]